MTIIQSKRLPWRTHSDESTGFWHVLQDSDGLEIGSGDGGYEEEDARRIVACVNACEGIPTELLEQGISGVIARLNESYKTNDALLAALKIASRVLKEWDACCTTDVAATFYADDELAIIDSAIEKAEKP